MAKLPPSDTQDAFVTIPLIPSLSGEGVLIPAEARRGAADCGEYRQAADAYQSKLVNHSPTVNATTAFFPMLTLSAVAAAPIT